MKKYLVWTYLEDGKVQIDQNKKAQLGEHEPSRKGHGWAAVVELEQDEYCYDLDNHGNGDGTRILPELSNVAGHATPRGYHTIWLGQRSHKGTSGLIDYKGPRSLLFAPPTPGYTQLAGTPTEMTDSDRAAFDKYLARTYKSQFGGNLSVLDIPIPKVKARFKLPVYYTTAKHDIHTVPCDCVKPFRWYGTDRGYDQIESRHAELWALWHKIRRPKDGVLKIDARWLGEAAAIFELAMSTWVCPQCDYKHLSFLREVTKFINSTPCRVANRTQHSVRTEMLTPQLPKRGIVAVVGQSLAGKSTVTMPLIEQIDRPIVWISSDNPSADLYDRFSRPRIDNEREVVENVWIYSAIDVDDEVASDIFEESTSLVEICQAAVAEAGIDHDSEFVLVVDTVQGIYNHKYRNDDPGAPQSEHKALLREFPRAIIMLLDHSPKDKFILQSGKATALGTSGKGAIPRIVINVGHVVDALGFWQETPDMGKPAEIAFTVVGNDIEPKTYLYTKDTKTIGEIEL